MHLAMYLAKANTTEAPCEEITSHLSDILEENPDPKYELSPKACLGILTRANRRGKKLPKLLEEALTQRVREGSMSDALPTALKEDCVGFDGYNGCLTGDVSSTLGVNCGLSTGRNGFMTPVIALDRASYNQGKNAQFDIGVNDKGVAQSLVAKGPGAVCYGIQGSMIGRAAKNGPQGDGVNEDVSFTLNTTDRHAVCYSVDQGGGKSACNVTEGTAPTLTCTHGGEPAVCYGFDAYNQSVTGSVTKSLTSIATDSDHIPLVINQTRYIVRRLTPLECERLQGFPDGWTDIGEYIDSNGKKKQSSDAARYKALGNSIAIPPWKWVLKRLCACYERDATMASLFDGIGGFPLIWEQLNGKGTCLWASEIEEFPIAVTKARIGGD